MFTIDMLKHLKNEDLAKEEKIELVKKLCDRYDIKLAEEEE